MIGLFGIFRRDRNAPADASQMAASVSNAFNTHTLPGQGAALGRVWHRNGGETGHAISADGKMEAVLSGGIYNVTDPAFADFRSPDAVTLLLRLVQAERIDLLAQLNGQFCAAIHDRAAHRLILVTDRLATFPVHIFERDGDVYFASQLHTLLADPAVPRRANPEALAQLFTIQRTIGDITSLDGVTALPAAAVVTFDGSERHDQRYWTLVWREERQSQGDAAERLAFTLRQAMKRQTDPGRTGLLLSGGLDSRMLLAAAESPPPSCWTTASFAENPELEIAKTIADLFGATHRSLIVEPADTLPVLEQTVIESGGQYPASTPMSAFLPAVGAACSSALTGHGLDYTLRGYYLPSKFLNVGGSKTRLPTLRPISKRPSGKEIFEHLRQGPPRHTIDRIVDPGYRQAWWQRQEDAFETVLSPWLDSDQPYNAWDAFILHSVNKHYAFTGMMAVRAACDLRMPAFDNDVFDFYLGMSPAQRCSGRIVQLALRRLSAEAARIPNANTGFAADLHGWLEIGGLLGRAALRRSGLLSRPSVRGAGYSAGSWQNILTLYREEPTHRQRFMDIRDRLDALSFGILDCDALAACIDEHLEGTAAHTKLLRQLLTHDAWVRCFDIDA